MTLEILTQGERSDRPALLFVHGAYHDAHCWEYHYLPWFAGRGWHANAISLRGHGASTGDLQVERPGLTDYLDDIRAAMDRIGGPVVLVGHSMGGVLSQMARAQDRRVIATVLLASSPLRPALRVIAKIFVSEPVAFLRSQLFGDVRSGQRSFATFFFSPSLDPGLKARYVAGLSGESPRALREVFSREAPETPDLSARPVLVIAGRDDWSIPIQDHQRLAEWFSAHIEICPGSHDLMLDPEWQASAQAIDVWLREVTKI